jgi:hypothetical protein
MESLYSKPVTAENPRISNRSIFLEYPKRIEQDTIVMFLDIVLKGLKPNYTVNNTNDSNKTWVVIDLPQGDKYVSKTGYTNFIYKKTQPVIHTLTQGNVKKLKALILPPSDKIINKPVKAVIPIPLPYIDYMVKCPEIPLREEITTGSTYKSLKQEVDSLIPGVHADIGVTAAMLTAELYPSTLTLASAWEVIPYLEQHIIDILSSFEDIKYIASTIEVHTNKPPSKSKSKTEPPTKSKFKPKTKGSDEEQVEDITRVRKALDQQEETLTKVKKMAKCTEKAKEKVRIEMEEAQEKEEEQAKQLLAKGIVLEVADPDSKKGYLQSLAKEERKQKRIESIAKSLYNDLNNSDSKSSDNKQPKKKKKVAVVNKESDSEEETKVNVIVINKANNQEDEDKKRELPKVTDSNRYVHSLLTGTKTKKDITSEEYVQEILRVFTTYNEDLKVTLKSGLLMEEGYQRAISFAKLNKIIKEKTKKDNVSLLTTYAEEIYEKLREIGSTLITSIGTIQYSSGIPPPTKLLGLPHLHMLLARTKNTKLGEYNENSDYFNALRFPNTIFGDIYIEDHHSVISTRDNKGRPGGKVSMDDANILTYIIKNSDYKEAVPRLNRYPFTLYNIRKIEKVNNLYNYI